MERLDEALELAKTVSEKYPQWAAARDTLGWIQYLKGITAQVSLDEWEQNRIALGL